VRFDFLLQEHVDVLADAVKALDALRLGEGPRGRSPTLAAAGGALSSPPLASAAPAQPAQVSRGLGLVDLSTSRHADIAAC
jgi:hypothetical protein